MSSAIDDGNGAYKKRLQGIYWTTFVGFVNTVNGDANCERSDEESRKITKREGSFEYMELTTKDNVSLQSETDSCSSNENSPSDSVKEDRSSSSNGSMYVVLDMHRKREIHINDEIAIFDGSPIRRHSSFSITCASATESPKCSPRFHEHISTAFIQTCSPILGNSQARAKTVNNIDEDEAILSDVDSSYDEIYYQNQNTEPKFGEKVQSEYLMKLIGSYDHSIVVQRWMVPKDTNCDDDEFIESESVPLPEFDFCHYTPTLEVILEESEESEEDRSQNHKHGVIHDSICLNDTDIVADLDLSHSANDLSHCSGYSQNDLCSNISTCGSLGSLKRMNTLENLSFDDCPYDELAEGSSDEYDRYQGEEMILSDSLSELSPVKQLLTPSNILLSLPRYGSISPSSDISSRKLSVSEEAIPSLSISSIPDYESDWNSKSNCSMNSSLRTPNSSPVKTGSVNDGFAIDDGKDKLQDQTSENLEQKTDHYQTERKHVEGDSSENNIHSLSARNIPDIVIAMVNEPNDELSNTYPRKTSDGKVNNNSLSNGQTHQYQRRLERQKTDPASNLVLKNASHHRIAQMKITDSSRLSAMSSSTPELSAMTDDTLLYIPVSYAREAAAIKKKRKRRATISASDVLRGRTAANRALQTRTIISGSGLKFGTLKKKFSRSIGNSLRRSDSDKPKIYYSNPEVTAPTTPQAQIDTLVRPASAASASSAHKVGGARRKTLRAVVSNIFRRLSSRFSSQNVDMSKTKNGAGGKQDPAPKSSLLLIKEESSTSDSISVYSSARESVGTSSNSNELTSKKPVKPHRIYSDISTDIGMCLNASDDFRFRSYSMPTRPRSSPSKQESDDSDVFLSQGHGDECSLDKTVYV